VSKLIETYPDITYLFDGYGPIDPSGPDAVFKASTEFVAFEKIGEKISHTLFPSDEGPLAGRPRPARLAAGDVRPRTTRVGSNLPNVTSHLDGVTYEEAHEWLDRMEGLSRRDRTDLEKRALRDLLGGRPSERASGLRAIVILIIAWVGRRMPTQGPRVRVSGRRIQQSRSAGCP